MGITTGAAADKGGDPLLGPVKLLEQPAKRAKPARKAAPRKTARKAAAKKPAKKAVRKTARKPARKKK